MHEAADRVLGPTTIARWAFSTSKAVDEILALGFAREGVPTIVARFFNTVGPRQNGAYGYVVPTFVAQALLGKDITIYGDGNQTRCFCDVEDTVRAVLGLIDREGFTGEVYNIGSSDEISINDLAARVLEETGSSSTVRHVPYEKAYGDGYEDMLRRVPDTSKIRQAIGWTPRLELGAIIKRTIDHAIEVGPQKLLGS
jgi:UDP-glucose 4-epimerase